jgi:hypothetical protein
MSSQIVISSVSEDRRFAQEVYDYPYSKLERQKQFEESRNLNISKKLITQDIDADMHCSNVARIHLLYYNFSSHEWMYRTKVLIASGICKCMFKSAAWLQQT